MTQTAVSTHEESAPNVPQSYLLMPYNQYVWLRKEFMHICGDMVEAMIMRVVEYEIEGDRRAWVRKATEFLEQGKELPQEPEWWITLSHKQIIARLYESVKDEKTIRRGLQSLEKKKFLLVRQNPECRYGSPQYTINRSLVQEKINTLPPLPGIRDAAKSQVDHLPETVPPTTSGTPSQFREEPPTRNGTTPLPETVPPPYQTWEEPPTRNGTPYKNNKNNKKDRKTEKNTSRGGDASASRTRSVSPPQENETTSLEEMEIQAKEIPPDTIPPENIPRDVKRVELFNSVAHTTKQDGAHKQPKDEPTPEQKQRAISLRALIKQYRGYNLAQKGAIINESKRVNELVGAHTDTDLFDTLHYLFHCDFKWSKPDNKYKIGAQVISDEIDRILRQFEDDPSLRTATEPPEKPGRSKPSVRKTALIPEQDYSFVSEREKRLLEQNKDLYDAMIAADAARVAAGEVNYV
jgi:hypothetical protein